MVKTARVPVTLKSVIQRLNRKLEKEEKMLKAARGAKAKHLFGDYVVVDIRNGYVIPPKPVDVEKLAREVGALREWEEVVR